MFSIQRTFRCEFHGYDLCFFGGVCQTNSLSGQESCVCPEGFGHDFIPLHNMNCSLPDWALPYFSIVFALVWVLVFVYFAFKRRTARTPQLHTLANYTMLYHLSLAFLVLCYYIEGGLFQFTGIAAVLCYILNGIVLIKVLSLTLEIMHPHYAYGVDQYRSNFRGVEIFVWGSNFCMGLPVSWILRKEYQLSPAYADFFISVYSLSSVASIALLGMHFWKTANELIRLVEKSAKLLPPRTSTSEVVTRVRTVQQFLVFNSNLMMFITVFIVLIRLTVGSVPFLWVYFFCGEMSANLIPLGVSVFFVDAKKSVHRKRPQSSVGVAPSYKMPSFPTASDWKSEESGVLLFPSSFDL